MDWIGLGTGPETDPYLAKTNAACLNGDLAECFKSRALGSLDEFFNKVSNVIYWLFNSSVLFFIKSENTLMPIKKISINIPCFFNLIM